MRLVAADAECHKYVASLRIKQISVENLERSTPFGWLVDNQKILAGTRSTADLGCVGPRIAERFLFVDEAWLRARSALGRNGEPRKTTAV